MMTMKKPPFFEKVFDWLTEKSPLLFQAATKAGDFSLHFAAALPACPLRILSTIIEKYPKALEIHGHNGDLPLHAAAKTPGESKENIRLILDKYPKAACEANNTGKLPLHLACTKKDAPCDIIDMLIAANPDCLSVYDNKGYLPLHCACVQANDLFLVNHLTRKLNGSLLPSTKDGVSALFLACEQGASLDVIFTLVQYSQEMFSGDMFSGRSNKKSRLACSESLRGRRRTRKT